MTGGGRMDNTGKKLAKLFDFQKYENESHLAGVISDTEKAFTGIRAMSDDDLDMVAGGAKNNNNIGTARMLRLTADVKHAAAI